jgi:sugar phosphate isomerase/epimerase
MFSTDRRGFISALAAAAAAPAAGFASSPGESDLKLGVATYSLREFSRRLAIKTMRELKISYVSIKEFHLLYSSTPEEIAKAVGEFAAAGLTVLSGGVISMQKDDEAALHRMFEYARLAKMPMMIIAPSRENMPRIEKLVREYNIKVAIHNHGPEDKHFPGTKEGLAVIRNMDPRIGLCIDVGHEARTGVDVAASIAQCGDRLLDVHIKDIVEATGKNRGAVVGQGVLPIVAIFKQLLKMKYQGGVMLEYEIDGDNPEPGMQRSFAYMRGVLAGLAAGA